jgi:multicomponent Na+:H+ antiporter subunit D
MHQTGKTYIYELDGMGKKMPVTFGCLTISSLSLMGIPLFAGFISKWNLAEAALNNGDSWLPTVGVAVILYSALMTCIYMMTVIVRAYFPQIKKTGGSAVSVETKNGEKADPNWRMLLPLLIFAVMILLIGLHSGPLTDFLALIGGEAG